MHLIRSWKFSLYIKLHKILEKFKLTSFVGYYYDDKFVLVLMYYSAVIMPYKEEFVSEEEICVTNSSEEFVYMRNLCILSFTIMFGFRETKKICSIFIKKRKKNVP